MGIIKIRDLDREIEYSKGQSLLEALRSHGIKLESPCGGKGTCGKCKLFNVTKGKEVLACKTFPEENIEIELKKEAHDHRILTTGATRRFEFNPPVEKKKFNIRETDIGEQATVIDRIKEALDINEVPIELLKYISRKTNEYTGVFYDEELIGIERGDTSEYIYGLAVDIGTTTIVMSLVDLLTGRVLESVSDINGQKDFGFDVLTRITYLIENENGIEELQDVLVCQLNGMIDELLDKTKINRKLIYDVVISANSTMMHTLLGLDSSFIGISPYAPIFTESFTIEARNIGIRLDNARLYGIPAVSSFIGADIVSGIYVSSMAESDGNILFIDIGTNGEIVLLANGEFLSCSCAAGPALEGMNISIGMRAAEGAIENIRIGEEKVLTEVIGGREGKGICGSGILSAMNELVRTGIVERGGAFVKVADIEEGDFRLNHIGLDGKKRNFIVQKEPRLLLTQSDIRQIQLAKGAILSGFYALLNKAHLSMGELDKIIIAGQFGSHLSTESLVGSGILPLEVEDKIEYVGNSSLSGAMIALLSKKTRDEMKALRKKVNYLELSATDDYERLFARCLRFD
ncbi:MAG: DUF4445 domain-containing protein [Tissierellia bacterium]|nr:DUF4445 domain-containing protein [Tissierellia bacterium]